jgi:phosphoribosyl 1,2-cyclic phosphodiesterase
MSLHFTVLASGSSGNASLLEAHGFGVLIDAGLGPRQLAMRLAAVGRSWHRIHAVVLTHTHGDHWRERTFAFLCRHGIPLLCHPEHVNALVAESAAFCDLREMGLVRFYQPGETLILTPELRCRPFEVAHDGGVTCGFRFDGPVDFFGERPSLGYVADLGHWRPALVDHLVNVDLLAVEFNHDVHMERRSSRPRSLVARVLGDWGHLSNEQAAALVGEVIRRSEPGRLRHVVQLHLSRDCNRPWLARAAVQRLLTAYAVELHTAQQYRPGLRLRLGGGVSPPRRRVRVRRLVSAISNVFQPWLPGWEDETACGLAPTGC